ncbi:hypothetical protein Q3W71_23895 [Micromonospora sp. C28SCA-DRY-2]|uniref:hypothetical protein n=1 Tax=Micromonospora sp. C28SCA-DRY-2 TaxID=3059522 RepID=UPI002675AECF|nr:hypothetical protein [Micromonospora sp. C28SCA-DRY-2]MDO3704710.1 hypothetical protein [Micromonospora sp. C28SCA-DRY-2]
MDDLPHHDRASPPPADDATTALASDEDIADADDILVCHPPRVVTRWLCGCGEDYPCPDVRFARLVKTARVSTAR